MSNFVDQILNIYFVLLLHIIKSWITPKVAMVATNGADLLTNTWHNKSLSMAPKPETRWNSEWNPCKPGWPYKTSWASVLEHIRNHSPHSSGYSHILDSYSYSYCRCWHRSRRSEVDSSPTYSETTEKLFM